MTRWRRSPRQVGFALERARDQWEPETLLAEIQRAWGEAVGEAISAQTRPSSERGGVLTVSCSASVWAHELDLMAPVIIERLNVLLGGSRVERLRCVALPSNEFRRR